MATIETHQPASIPRSRMLGLLRELGLDPAHITEDGVHIGPRAITCEIQAIGLDGKPVVLFEQNRIATHKISIPVVNDDPE